MTWDMGKGRFWRVGSSFWKRHPVSWRVGRRVKEMGRAMRKVGFGRRRMGKELGRWTLCNGLCGDFYGGKIVGVSGQVERVGGEGWGDEWGDVTGHFNSLRLFPRCGVESCFEVPV